MNEFPVVLVINCGSSSIKFSVLDVATCDLLIAGIADGINTENAFLSINGDKPLNLAHLIMRARYRLLLLSWKNVI
ncbi:propionate/acetate kinase [Salmonella enterica subsp. arizonae]|uniref:Propionate/acetate kinase n=1 Tax=Salmonella enterica subsp. arizonae TaxID=59203 RepID=A0A379SSS4_SALER|nr:propionate/acetate kinase [Salmonella enterica subsp. arizonae]